MFIKGGPISNEELASRLLVMFMNGSTGWFEFTVVMGPLQYEFPAEVLLFKSGWRTSDFLNRFSRVLFLLSRG